MFTSRLPKSTSARRPSNPHDGSTSFLASGIPVSVRKANLFTPQPNRSMHNGMNSTSRKSYLNTEKKYQSKPAPDREAQLRMFENLTDYLRMHEPNFPLPEAKKFFMSVSTTECSRIFEFLIGRLNGDFKITKLETDVPEALAALEYPYLRAVTKSALVSITTRQAIVNLLVIFDWLVKECKDADTDELMPTIDDDENDPPILTWILSDPSEQHDIHQKIAENATASDLQVGSLEEVIDARDRLAEKWDEIQRSEVEKQAFVNDIEACDKYISQINDYLKLRLDQETNLDQKILQIQDELSDAKEEFEKLSPILDLDLPACDAATLAHLMKKLEKAENDLVTERSAVASQLVNVDLKKQDIEFTKNKYETQRNKLISIKTSEHNGLKVQKNFYDETVKTNTKRVQEYSETYLLEMTSIIRKDEEDDRKLAEVCRQVKDNNKIARSASRKLKI